MEFGELKLPVATRMQLNFIGLDYKRYPSDASLLGYRNGESILVHLPKKPPQVLVREGIKIEAKFALQMGIVSFASTILRVCEQPYPYLHFAWPQTIEVEPLRRFPRFPFQLPLQLTAFTAAGIATAKVRGRFCDISLQGARFGLEKELTSVVTKVLLSAKVTVAAMEHSLDLHGEIKRAFGRDEKAADNPFTYGVLFSEMPSSQRLLMLALCQELQSGSDYSN
jgi:hypothetical protein